MSECRWGDAAAQGGERVREADGLARARLREVEHPPGVRGGDELDGRRDLDVLQAPHGALQEHARVVVGARARRPHHDVVGHDPTGVYHAGSGRPGQRRSSTIRATMGIARSFAAAAFLLLAIAAAGRRRAASLGFTAESAAPAARDRGGAARASVRRALRGRSTRELTRAPHVAGTEGSRRVAEEVARAPARVRPGDGDGDLRRPALFASPRGGRAGRAPRAVRLARPEAVLPEDPLSREPSLALPWHAYARSGDVTADVVYVNHGRAEDYEVLARLGHRRARQDRPRPLLQGLPRRQEPGGGAPGRGRPDHLLRSRGGRLRAGRRVPEGAVGTGEPLPARRQRVRLHRARRSADSGLGLGGGGAAHPRVGVGDPAQDPERPPLVPGRARDPGGAGRTGASAAGVAGRRAVHVPRRPGPGAGAPLAGHPARGAHDPQRDRAPAAEPIPTPRWPRRSSCSRTITTPGPTAASTRPPAPPPRWSWRARSAISRAEGMRPRRTIVFGIWDAEEFTLTGSTEWGEEHADELRAQGGGLPQRRLVHLRRPAERQRRALAAAASSTRSRARIPDPKGRGSVYDVWAAGDSARPRGYGVLAGESTAEPTVAILGSGSDYTVFFNHIGVPSVDFLFDGPVRRVPLDLRLPRVDEPARRSGLPLPRGHGRASGAWPLRLANADVLPFDYAAYGRDIVVYLDEVEALARQRRSGRGPRAAARRQAAPPGRAARRPRPPAARTSAGGATRPSCMAERDLIAAEGLPGRPWFRHLVYAPLPSYAGGDAARRPRGGDGRRRGARVGAGGASGRSALRRAADRLEAVGRPVRRREPGRGLRARAWAALRTLLSRDIVGLTNAIAFNFLLCLFPLLLVVVAAAQQLPGRPPRGGSRAPAARRADPVRAARPSRRLLRSLSKMAKGLEIFSLVLIVWGSSGIFMPVEMALNRVWGGRSHRAFVRSRLLAFAMTLAGSLLAFCLGRAHRAGRASYGRRVAGPRRLRRQGHRPAS